MGQYCYGILWIVETSPSSRALGNPQAKVESNIALKQLRQRPSPQLGLPQIFDRAIKHGSVSVSIKQIFNLKVHVANKTWIASMDCIHGR